MLNKISPLYMAFYFSIKPVFFFQKPATHETARRDGVVVRDELAAHMVPKHLTSGIEKPSRLTQRFRLRHFPLCYVGEGPAIAGFESGEQCEQSRSGFDVRTREKVAVQQHYDSSCDIPLSSPNSTYKYV